MEHNPKSGGFQGNQGGNNFTQKIKCFGCGSYVPKNKINQHKNNECKGNQGSGQKIKCYGCGKFVEKVRINSHKDNEC